MLNRSGGPFGRISSAAPLGRAAGSQVGVVEMRRPNPLLWLWYTFGGSLGPCYGQWVLHDTTCRTRWLRQAARAVVQVAPFAAVVLTVAAKSNWLTWAAIGLGLLLALWYSLAYIDSIAEWRLAGHGDT